VNCRLSFVADKFLASSAAGRPIVASKRQNRPTGRHGAVLDRVSPITQVAAKSRSISRPPSQRDGPDSLSPARHSRQLSSASVGRTSGAVVVVVVVVAAAAADAQQRGASGQDWIRPILSTKSRASGRERARKEQN